MLLHMNFTSHPSCTAMPDHLLHAQALKEHIAAIHEQISRHQITCWNLLHLIKDFHTINDVAKDSVLACCMACIVRAHSSWGACLFGLHRMLPSIFSHAPEGEVAHRSG